MSVVLHAICDSVIFGRGSLLYTSVRGEAHSTRLTDTRAEQTTSMRLIAKLPSTVILSYEMRSNSTLLEKKVKSSESSHKHILTAGQRGPSYYISSIITVKLSFGATLAQMVQQSQN
ncbi:unnamed protein product [Ixodes pacificus]